MEETLRPREHGRRLKSGSEEETGGRRGEQRRWGLKSWDERTQLTDICKSENGLYDLTWSHGHL